jgi:predicted RNA binding protein YcfA (HicA-like mRNA interferase family)
MPSRSELPGLIKKKKFIKALERCGFTIGKKGEKGGHFKAIYKNEKSITLPSSDLEKYQSYYIIKEIEAIRDITWKDISRNL